MDVWMGVWVAGWLVGWVAVWMCGWVAGWLCGWVAGWLGDWVAGWMGGCVDGWLGGCVAGWLGGCVAGWLGGWTGPTLSDACSGQSVIAQCENNIVRLHSSFCVLELRFSLIRFKKSSHMKCFITKYRLFVVQQPLQQALKEN